MFVQDGTLSVSFYLVGKKGHDALFEFIKLFGVEAINLVVAALFNDVQKD